MSLTPRLRTTIKVLLDVTALSGAFFLAVWIGAAGIEQSLPRPSLVRFSILAVVVQIACLTFARVPKFPWRYVSLFEARRIAVGLAAAGLILFFVSILSSRYWYFHVASVYAEPLNGFFLIHFFVSIAFVLGMRVLVRMWRERTEGRLCCQRKESDRVPTLLVGSKRLGAHVVKSLTHNRQFGINPVGFLDDDTETCGSVIYGVPVVGNIDSLPLMIEKFGAKQVLITMSNPPGVIVRQIVDLCKPFRITPKIIPGLGELIEGKTTLTRIREVAIEDLLRRDPVQLDMDAIAAFVQHRNVLVTGAGGSIGSELCRLIGRFNPSRLLLVERSENALFEINRELAAEYPELDIIPFVADVCDTIRMKRIFAGFEPDLILHAAAHKHVPMMEYNPGEAVKNNVLGTRNLADLAHAHGVSEFVMISTDKAVNPTSVMGVSKRIAEMYVQALAKHSPTRFVTVRFGNVLGSNGSVIPIFKQQIAKGGPVTVTHPEMVRFFMTIPEACHLVLQAATMGNGGEIFILDMGEPVKILDLATDLIRLSGLSVDEIEIRFSGIRPGEKLYEELALKEEIAAKTKHPKIFIGRRCGNELKSISVQIEQLGKMADHADSTSMMSMFQEIVPTYSTHASVAAPKRNGIRRDVQTEAFHPIRNGAAQAHVNGNGRPESLPGMEANRNGTLK